LFTLKDNVMVNTAYIVIGGILLILIGVLILTRDKKK